MPLTAAKHRLGGIAGHLNHHEPPTSKQADNKPENTPFFKDNQFLDSQAREFFFVHDPATNRLLRRVPQNTQEELEGVVDSAERAFPAWRAASVFSRQRIMFKFVDLIKANLERLAACITLEQGKTLDDARGDVKRGLQVAEAACAAPELLKGEVLEVAKHMETRSHREPLGVVAAICPFSKTPVKALNHTISRLTRGLRFSSNDSPLDPPCRYSFRQHACHEAVGASAWSRFDPCRALQRGWLP